MYCQMTTPDQTTSFAPYAKIGILILKFHILIIIIINEGYMHSDQTYICINIFPNTRSTNRV